MWWLACLPLVLGLLYGLWPEDDEQPVIAAGDVAEADDEDRGDSAQAVMPAIERESGDDLPKPIEWEPHPSADLSHPYEFRLEVRAFDRFALPVAEAMVFVAPPNCGFSKWPEETDAMGRVSLHWRARVRAMDVQVAVMVWGVLQPIRSVRCEVGSTSSVAIAVRGRKQDAQTVMSMKTWSDEDRDAAKRTVERLRKDPGKLQKVDELDVLCGRTQLLFQEVFSCVDCHDAGRLRMYSMLSRAGTMHGGLHPFAGFHDLRMRAVGNDDARRKHAEAAEEEKKKDRPRRALGRGVIRGVVRDSRNRRISDVPVVWRDGNGGILRQTLSRAGGRYALIGLPETTVDLVAGGGAYGFQRKLVMVTNGAEMTADFRLEMRSVVRGEAVDIERKPLNEWRVELERSEGDWALWTKTNRDGKFAFAGVPGPAECLLWARDERCQLPIVYGTTALVDGSVVSLALDKDRPTRARLRLQPAVPDGRDPSNVDARLLQLETGRVAMMKPFGFEHAVQVELLPPGSYVAQVGAPGLGWVQTGTVIVDGRGLWNLGLIPLPAPGTVRIESVAGATSPFSVAHEIFRRTEAVDVRAEEQRNEEDRDVVTLPADDYVLVWRDGEELRSREFRVTSREETVLTVGPR